MLSLETGSPTTVGLEKCNISDTQKKEFKIPIMNIFNELRGYKNVHQVSEMTSSRIK